VRKGPTRRRAPNQPTASERRRRRRIRWVLGIWAGLIFLAAVAYAVKKQIDRSHQPHGRAATPGLRP
jgi:hypothetical protein